KMGSPFQTKIKRNVERLRTTANEPKKLADDAKTSFNNDDRTGRRISGDIQKHFRIKLRNIFVKLIRKFGYETIVGMLPETHRKLVSNIRKVEERKKRRKQQHGDHDEESGNEDLEKEEIAAAKTGTEG
ncbi:hypothetical protein ISCGN_001414, partial [Ixodes scapularis]